MSHRAGALITVAAAATLAACGTSSGSAAPQTAAAPAAHKTAVLARVAIKDFDYSPRRLTVRRGAAVTWTDRDATNHTVTFTAKGIRSIENLRQGEHASIRFRRRGTYRYVCSFHPNMHGIVVVR